MVLQISAFRDYPQKNGYSSSFLNKYFQNVSKMSAKIETNWPNFKGDVTGLQTVGDKGDGGYQKSRQF